MIFLPLRPIKFRLPETTDRGCLVYGGMYVNCELLFSAAAYSDLKLSPIIENDFNSYKLLGYLGRESARYDSGR